MSTKLKLVVKITTEDKDLQATLKHLLALLTQKANIGVLDGTVGDASLQARYSLVVDK